MSREKQIEEMARAMCPFSKNTLCRECSDECFYKDYAERAYNAGYRKQSEGEWLFNWSGMCLEGTDAPLNYKCSLCDEYATDPFSFCPHCGAKMKGGE